MIGTLVPDARANPADVVTCVAKLGEQGAHKDKK